MSNLLVATKGRLLSNGLYEIHLDGFQNKNHLSRLSVRSGLAGRQKFRTLAKQVKGQYEPCPEGVYNLGPLLWAGGKAGDYKTLWPAVSSPVWVEIYAPRAIGFHFDAGTPGSAGCIVFPTVEIMKQFVNWWNGYGGFDQLIVDWGLGSVKLPDHVREKLK